MASGEEWVTWPQAAEIVGCPVPTIDWFSHALPARRQRLGRADRAWSASTVERLLRRGRLGLLRCRHRASLDLAYSV